MSVVSNKPTSLFVSVATPRGNTSFAPVSKGGGAISAIPHATEDEALRYAQKQVASYDTLVYRLVKVVRQKPVPVEIDVISACDDVE